MTIANGSTIAPASGLSRRTRVISVPLMTDTGPTQLSGEPPTGPTLAHEAAVARRALREAASAAAEAAARALSLAELLDEALLTLTAQEGSPAPAPARLAIASPATGTLTAREREVLALVAEGYTNKAIAEALYVSPNTIKTHVASLLNKLQADSRVQLAAIATSRGLHRRSTPN